METNPELRIDLMDLADIGGNPQKLAHEIHRQLRLQYGSVPNEVPLEGIARSIGIEDIVEHPTEAFEGTLIVNGPRGIVALRKGMRQGRRRFTLGHEIGHFVNPWHRTTTSRFECSVRDTRMQRASGGRWVDRPPQERMEVEANEFSNALLIPMLEYKEARRLLGSDPDIAHIRSLADSFKVSLQVMSQTYVKTEKETIGVILSQHGKVKRLLVPSHFPYLGLSAGAPLPHDCISIDLLKTSGAGTLSTMDDALGTGWLERQGNVSCLYEQVLLQQNGWALTLLWAEIEEPDEDSDERQWDRGVGPPWS